MRMRAELAKACSTRLSASLLVAGLAGVAAAQVWSESEAVGHAKRIALACGDGPPQRLVADGAVYRRSSGPSSPLEGTGVWMVTFGRTVVTVCDGAPRVYSWSGPSASDYLNIDEKPFVPFYASRQDVADRARQVCRSLGLERCDDLGAAGTRIIEPGEDGTIRNRSVYVTMNESGDRYPTLVGGNHVNLALDASTGDAYSIKVKSGFRFEPEPARLVPQAEALEALRAVVDLGEVRSVRGPAYMELLGGGTLTAEGARYREQGLLPLVYAVMSDRHHGAVSAVSGKVLRTMGRDGIGVAAGPGSGQGGPEAGRVRQEPAEATAASPPPLTGFAAAGAVLAAAIALWLLARRKG